jgi:hypothetical protein
MSNKSEIKIIMDLVQLLKQKEERIAQLEQDNPLSAHYTRPHNPFLRFGGTSRRSNDNADVPTPKKDTQEKTAQTSLDEPLILK